MITLDQEQVLTAEEAAAYLRLSETTVYRLLDRGELPGRKVGGQWRILRSALEAYLAATVAPEHPEPDSAASEEAAAPGPQENAET